MIPGLYERLISESLQNIITQLPESRVEREALDPGESHTILSQYVGHLLAQTLSRVPPENRVSVCNGLIMRLMENNTEDHAQHNQLVNHPQPYLLAVKPPAEAGVLLDLPRPDTPLALNCLLTGTRADPSLVSQIQRELKTADRVDILCSFIKWSGIRVLESALRAFTSRPESRLRIITTSYMGATDVKAVEFLRGLPHTEIKISYDTRRTRLHAKAYAFCRNTEFGTAYIGSSNLSHAALTDGLEWNIKISQYESAHLWDKVVATFETYWNDAEFTTYGEADEGRLRDALAQERNGALEVPAFFVEIRPYPYQQEILDKLEAERTYLDRSRHLVVAATGTGKTVIAALDYRRFRHRCQLAGRTSRLLFIAHRREILEQSVACFRAVLRDANFGELMVGPHEAQDRQHLFVSIQSYNTQQLWKHTSPDYYDYVVIDETHRVGAAKMYQALVDHVNPRVLLGLTATPERTDGQSILDLFGGQISAEIRLPTAINRKLLCPFQYFGITDAIDLSRLTWRHGGYAVEELDQLFTDNALRAQLVVDKVRDILLDPLRACGLGFCVSIRHADYMADYFGRAGIPAVALSSGSSDEERTAARRRLIAREINFLFVVDLYNEGVDIPEVDTVLFLRPTESLTVFLQQLGRGLRLCDGKDCLTVLDFIGQAHRQYNFEMRYRAMMDHPKRRLDREMQDDSMPLPAGCTITLEKLARQYILDNIQRALSGRSNALVQRLQTFQEDTGHAPTLARFLNYYEMEPDDLYRRCSWSQLRESAGLYSAAEDPDASFLAGRLRRLEHISGPHQIRRLQQILTVEPSAADGNINDQRLLLMLHASLWGDWKPQTIKESIDRLHSNPAHFMELMELLAYRLEKTPSVAPRLSLPFLCPLELHAAYTRDEILMALGFWSLQERPAFREGVKYLPQLPADAFFVTLNKTERDYSPTTMYADYAINERLFHWAVSECDLRYISNRTTVYPSCQDAAYAPAVRA